MPNLAEKFLESVEANQNYAILLLNLVGKEDVDMTIRVAGSIAFKNFVKRNWNAHAVSCAIFGNLNLLNHTSFDGTSVSLCGCIFQEIFFMEIYNFCHLHILHLGQ